MALDTLMEFDFRDRFMTHFLRDVVAIYLDHPSPSAGQPVSGVCVRGETPSLREAGAL